MTPPPDAEGQPGKELFDAIEPFAAKIVKWRDQMKAAGVFTDDRDLLESPQYGMLEDVTIDGLLITGPKQFSGEDTAEKFITLDNCESRWRCPNWGVEFLSAGFTK